MIAFKALILFVACVLMPAAIVFVLWKIGRFILEQTQDTGLVAAMVVALAAGMILSAIIVPIYLERHD